MKNIEELREENRNNGFGYLGDGYFDEQPVSTEDILKWQKFRHPKYIRCIQLLQKAKKRNLNSSEIREFHNLRYDDVGGLAGELLLQQIPSEIKIEEIKTVYGNLKGCLHAYNNELVVRCTKQL